MSRPAAQWGAALVFVALFAAGPQATARHHHSRTRSSEPQVFDYYLLSMSWSPAFCLQSPGSTECNGSRRFGLTLHGLWPQNEVGWPQNCEGDTQLPESVVERMTDLTPARALIRHEWAKHGTCSGLDPEAFFALARRAYETVTIPQELQRPVAALERAPDELVNDFMKANPRLPSRSVAITCSGENLPRLQEVHVCFDRKLTPRACSTDASRNACRAPTMLVPPIR